MLTRKGQSENLRDELYRCVSYNMEVAVSPVLEQQIWDRTSLESLRFPIISFLYFSAQEK